VALHGDPCARTQEHARGAAPRRRDSARSGVAALALLCAFLVSDGRVQVADPAGESLGGRTSEGAPALGVAEVASHLRRYNAALGERQLERIAAAVVRYSAKYELDPALVLGVMMAESSVRPWARSPKGAVGLMQVMPHMMGSLQLAGNLTSIESNIEAGCMILADNIRRLGEERGILAYFWGNDIRGVAYLERVQRARATVREAS
jgi:soluble lytic murein transglycosylase-like protein